jgi:alkylation response protein AidB-like acyl-CoA dehydrogenase
VEAPVTDAVSVRPPGERAFEKLHHDALECAELARSLARTTEDRRALPDELLTKLKDSGLLTSGAPRGVGGLQAPPGVSLAAAEAIARGDASTGWCVSIAMTSSLLAAYLPKNGADEVFGAPRSVAAGVWAPRGTGKPVGGGVVVSGQWPFCSGIPHADWLFAGFVLAAEGATPVLRVAAIPKSDLEILDTWHTGGLRGTGSHDTVATEVFVPDHRIMSVIDGPPEDADPLYRFPLFGYFALSVAVAALGNARGAIDDLVALAAGKKSPGSGRTLAERTHTQAEVARAEAAVRAAHLLVFQSVEDAWAAAQDEAPVSVSLRMGLRLAATHATRTAAEVASAMYDLGGGAAIYENSPLQRRLRDANTATAHFQVNLASFELTGRLLLGLPAKTEQL